MGLLSSEIIKFLQIANINGIKNKTLAMMGKQDININLKNFIKTIRDLGYDYDQDIAARIGENDCVDAFEFFKMLGFKEVHALDYSKFEGADIVFDLNEELPENLNGAFDYVINGGTLEHVFDIAKAMDNMSNMVKKDGFIMHISPAVGWVNHGFYSISPTFFQDYYSANGFQILNLELESIMSKNVKQGVSYRTFYSEDLRLFQKSSDLNQYISSLQCVPESGEIILVCIAKRKGVGDCSSYPIQGFYKNVYGKGSTSILAQNIHYKEWAFDIKNGNGKKALYGGGYVCNHLLNELYRIDAENEIEAIFDSNVEKAGGSFRGIKVLYPTQEKLEGFDMIYVCSADYENEIVDTLLENGICESCIRKTSEFV